MYGSSFARRQQNLKSKLPEDWQDIAIDNRDDERILSEIVDAPQNGLWMPLRTALQNSWGEFKKVSEKVESKLEKEVEDLLEEVKLIIGVRAACSVALRKLPLCKGFMSKSATLRECKRLLGALEIKELPCCVPNV